MSELLRHQHKKSIVAGREQRHFPRLSFKKSYPLLRLSGIQHELQAGDVFVADNDIHRSATDSRRSAPLTGSQDNGLVSSRRNISHSKRAVGGNVRAED